MTLDATWNRTTKRISGGENSAFNIKEMKTGEQDWSLGYDSLDKLDDAFFKTLSQVEIPNIMMYIGDRIGMWRSFTHMKTRYNKKKTPVASHQARTSSHFLTASNAASLSSVLLWPGKTKLKSVSLILQRDFLKSSLSEFGRPQ